ncbi:hypothetical protein LTS18_000390 [Coniosporium uncinatum]|uniref:Uncharacterized protein n=1 Tax=Coniosporium uncinatum TaxID=93489 RepID=A0ACC3D8L3_9PEZI|nr:hypothetical protein LTS18_000390 [Coniosporium uncinatum]
MQPLTLLLAALPATTLALAYPPSLIPSTLIPSKISAADILSKRANVGLYICADPGWTGRCSHAYVPQGVCIQRDNSVGGQQWFEGISSFGPDQGGYCVVYE